MGKAKPEKKLVLRKITLKNLKPKPGRKNAPELPREAAGDEAAAIRGGASNMCASK